jgi:signal transduction histidine kinase
MELLGLDELVTALVAAARDAQELANPKRRLRFQVDREAVYSLEKRLLQIDRSFFDQSVANLLDNAAKYSFMDQEVQIGAELTGNRYSICVQSIGQPVISADVARCTERNWRSPAAKAATGEGSGLGLWIVDNLMRSMDGMLEVEASGDTFRASLRFPVR